MTDLVKTLVVERNGVDLEDQEEIELTADNVFISDVNFTSDNVTGALVEALTASAGDIHSGQHYIDISDSLCIEEKKQMRIYQQLIILGELKVDGILTVEETA